MFHMLTPNLEQPIAFWGDTSPRMYTEVMNLLIHATTMNAGWKSQVWSRGCAPLRVQLRKSQCALSALKLSRVVESLW